MTDRLSRVAGSTASAACERRTIPGTRSAAYPWTVAIVSLLYLLLAVPCTHSPSVPATSHDTLEIVHLPRGASGNDSDAARIAQTLLPSDLRVAQVAGPAPKSGDLVPAALICAISLVLLAGVFSAARSPAVCGTAEAVLGVGRWHRAVVLLL